MASERTKRHPLVEYDIERLRTKWPQSHAIPNERGAYLIVVPSVILPRGYRENICTVLFIVPAGYPAARPDHFFTDIEIRLKNCAIPFNTNMGNGQVLETYGWPQWKSSMWWSWHLQMWDPNRCNLYQYMKVIQYRLNSVR